MGSRQLETDYLVVGAGAMGLAFVDELINRDREARVVMVDRRAKPGGHWNDAYPFVSLHQPAAYYGVNSLPLGDGGDALASGDEVLAYFGTVMRQLLASGRVTYHSMCEYEGQGTFRSLVAPDKSWNVRVRRRIVDATYMDVRVPSTTPPKYGVADGVTLVPLNELVRRPAPRAGYVVIGAGKTGLDALLFLLNQGVEPDHITWIVSNDAWLLRRELIQPGLTVDFFLTQLELFAHSDTIDEVFLVGESKGVMMRFDTSVMPTKFRCATVSGPELEQLRQIRNVVRLGRVERIERNAVVLNGGTWASHPDALYVDCTADGLAKRPIRPVFEGATMTLQSLLMCQQVFSASLIAYLETRYQSDSIKNALAKVVPHPEWTRDYVTTQIVSNENVDNWLQEIASWLMESRLCFAHHESRLKVLNAGLTASQLKVDAERQMRVIQAHAFPTQTSEDKCIELQNGNLRFTAHTAGWDLPKTRPLVLCLHGFPDNARSFRFQLPALADAGYRTLSATLRGYEPSSQPEDNDYSIRALAGDVIAWLDHLGEDKVHFVGHDWGAVVGYALGALYPERLHTLTTIAVPHAARFAEGARKVPVQALRSWYMFFFQLQGLSEHALAWTDWSLLKRLWRVWSPGFVLPLSEWAELRETFEAPGVTTAMLNYYRQNASPRALLGLAQDDIPATIAVPTLAVTGADDGCIDTRIYDHAFVAEDFPQGVRVERMVGGGHFVHQEKPDEFNRMLLAWLDGSPLQTA